MTAALVAELYRGHGQDDRDEYWGECHWCDGDGLHRPARQARQTEQGLVCVARS